MVRSEASWKVSRSPLAIRAVRHAFLPLRQRRRENHRPRSRRFRVLKAACGNKFRQHIKLLKQSVVEFSTALVGRELLMPVGRNLERVPGHQHGTRLLITVEPQQHIGKAEDGACGFSASPQDCFRQGVIGAMGK